MEQSGELRARRISGPLAGYVVAVAGTAAAALLRWVLGETVGEIPPFITFYPVALASAAIGGIGPGLLATGLTSLATAYFFIEPRGQLAIAHTPDAVALTIFVAINIAISLVGGRLRAVHQRVKAQNTEFQRSGQQLRLQATALQSAANAIVITDRQGAIQWTNEAFTRLTGYTAAEALTQNPRLLNSGKHDAAFFKQLWETIQAGRVWQGEMVNRRKDGSLYTEDMAITPVRDSQGDITHFIAVKQDVSPRKEAEARMLAFSQRRAADLEAMKRLHDVSTRFARQDDMHSLLGAVLDAAIAIIGANKGYVQLPDRASGELGIIVQKGFDQAFVEYFGRIRPGVVACGTAMQTKQRVIVEDITLSPLFLAEPHALQLKLAAGMRAIVCTPLLTRASEMLGVISAHFAEPHRPSDRDLEFLDMLARQAADFLERAQAEAALRRAQDLLARANAGLERTVEERTAKLRETIEELESFSYSIIHDMRAPLRAMENFAALAQEACAGCPKPEGLDYYRRMRIASNRMDQLIVDALNYSKVVREELPLAAVDIGKLLRGMVDTYPDLHPPAVEIQIELDAPLVRGNESALTQVFGNLLGNAAKFVAPGVKPRVRVWAEEMGSAESGVRSQDSGQSRLSRATEQRAADRQSDSALHAPQSALDLIRIWIEDNGIGIPPAAHEKIFGMFQRMHRGEEYPGTGIGLAIVRKAMERMGGQVGVESEPGKGSRFWIELPRGEPSRPP